MKPTLCAGLCSVSFGTLFWTGLLVHATSSSSAQEAPLAVSGIPSEFPSFSCCESNIEFKKKKEEQVVHQRGLTDVVNQKRTLDIFLNFGLTWVCNVKTTEPRQCVGRLTVTINKNPNNTSGAGPESSSITITRMTEQHECPEKGTKPASGIFGIQYSATYPDVSPVNGTLELNITLDPQSKGTVKHTFTLPVKTKAGKAVEFGPYTLKPIP